jgi:alpha 1,3-glucosidase
VLLSYWYTTFHNSSVTGLPIIRPMWVEYPNDRDTFTMQDQFMAGSDILVKPVTAAGQSSVTVYLPGQQPWYTMDGKSVHSGGQSVTVNTPLEYIPVFQRGGSIIPKKERARRNSELMRNDPYTLQIALNSKVTVG